MFDQTPQKPPRQKTWLVIGAMRYGTKKTDNELNKRAKYILDNPQLFSPKVAYKRKEYHYYDYKFVVNTADLIHAFDIGERKAQRLLQVTREKLEKNKNDYVTVMEFCTLHKLDEENFRKKLVRQPLK